MKHNYCDVIDANLTASISVVRMQSSISGLVTLQLVFSSSLVPFLEDLCVDLLSVLSVLKFKVVEGGLSSSNWSQSLGER